MDKEKIKKEFQEFLKIHREKKGYSVRGLAELTGISHTYLSQVETGKRGLPKPEILKKLYKPLGVDYRTLMEKAGYINQEIQQETIDLIEDRDISVLIENVKNLMIQEFTTNGIINENEAKYFFSSIKEMDQSQSENEIKELIYKPNFVQQLFDHLTISEQIELLNILIKEKIENPISEMFSVKQKDILRVPVLGCIAAGQPILANDHIEEWIDIPNLWSLKEGEVFVLKVKGDSMIGSRIFEGDRVVVKIQQEVENGEIAVVNVNGDEATLKRVKKIDGQVILYPDNPKYNPIFIKNETARIVGKVIQVMFEPK